MKTLIHKFEEAGLGIAPFQFVGVEEKTFQACPGAPIQAGGTCEFCGMGIRDCCIIKDSEGKTFIVGSTCVNKTGDKGLVNTVKREVNRKKKEAREAREQARIEKAKGDLESVRSIFDGFKHPNAFIANTRGASLADFVDFLLQNGGHSGQFRAAKMIEKAVKEGSEAFKFEKK